MMNVLNSENKSDYYIGMSIPSRQSEFTPNCVVSSETILDYDGYNPPPRQKHTRTQPPPASSTRKRRQPLPSNSGHIPPRHGNVFDIKEEEEEDTTTSEEEELSSQNRDDDILENDEYAGAYDDDSDDMKHSANPHSNPHSNPRSNSKQTTIHTSSHNNSNHNIIDEDCEFTQIQALQEQLQQQQRQLILQSHQLKQLKHQIKNQNDSDSENALDNTPPIPPPMNASNKPPMTQFEFIDNNANPGHLSSDSDDGLTSSPFPTLAFDEHNINTNAQNNNPNLSIPHTANRTIHSVEHGSFRQKRSPRTPKNPFSRSNSRNNPSNPSSPRKKGQHKDIQPPNAFNAPLPYTHKSNTPTQPQTGQVHMRKNSSSSYKSQRSQKSKSKKKSQKRKHRAMEMEPIAINIPVLESPPLPHRERSPRSPSNASKSRSHSSRKNRSHKSKSLSHHSNAMSPKKARKHNKNAHKSHSLSRDIPPIPDDGQTLNRKQLNLNYGTVNEQNLTITTQRELHEMHNLDLPSPRSAIHSPPASTCNSPPLSPRSPQPAMDEEEYSDHSDHSYSDGTTGQQHKLAEIALPSTYYNSECGDQHKIISGGTSSIGIGGGNVVDLFMDPLHEIEFTADNLELHNKKLEVQRQQNRYNKLSSKQKREPYHYHQHQHQHLHHHYHNNGAGGGSTTAADIINQQNGHGTHLGMNLGGLSHLSGVSTDSQALVRVFHPTNRMRSMFQDKEKKKLNLPVNPESQYSTAAALDPLDELDNMDVLNNYDKHKELGNGTDAFVYEVVDRRDKSHVAMKLTKRKSGRYKTEIHLLHQLRTCPYVVKLLNCLENDNVYVLILEHAPMSLENLLLQRCTKHPMQERVAKTILSQILKGIQAIHNLGFVHKDIKPENILIFANRSERKLIAKVADFGFATRVAPDNMISIDNLPREKYVEFEKHVRDRCGTPGFWPPELVTSLAVLKYAFEMDVFSAGVTLYRMLCNEMPFGIFESWKYNTHHSHGQAHKKLCKVKPNWKVISWIQSDNKYTPVLSSRKLSDTVKDLLRSMLRIRPEQRANVDSCLAHQFFSNNKKVKQNKSGGLRPNNSGSHMRNASNSNTYSNTNTYSESKHRKKRSNSSNRKYSTHRIEKKMKVKG